MTVTLEAPTHSSERLYDAVTRILASTLLCSMATQAETEQPYISTAFFASNEELDLYFLSDPASQHVRNLTRSPRMAVAVFDSGQRWGAAHKGLQLFGNCAAATGAEKRTAQEVYSGRFPEYPAIRDKLGHLRFYGFSPERIKILDEEEFGEEVFVEATVLR